MVILFVYRMIILFVSYTIIESDDCVDGSVRLQNGSIAQEGRVEVCVNGVWGIICGSGWDKNDALVVCRVLGYANSGKLCYCMNLYVLFLEPEISTNAKYGHGEGPIVFSYINCHGWESSLSSCSKSSYLQFTCSSSSYISGVLCTDGIKYCTEMSVVRCICRLY